jgi:uncharacterized iron-regulated membrane protein
VAKKTLRGTLLWTHRWVALATSLVLIVACFSGILLAFERPLTRAFESEANVVEVRGTAQPVRVWLDAALAANPGAKALSVRLPTEADDAAIVLLTQSKNVHVDPYRGTVLATRARGQSLGERINKLHGTLFAGELGHAVVALTTVLLLFLVGSGLYLFWPKPGTWRRALAVRPRGSLRRLAIELHNVVGFVTTLSAAVLAFSGAFMAYESTLAPLTYRALGGPTSHRLADTTGDGADVDADAALAAARAVVPGAKLTVLALPAADAPVRSYTVLARFPEDFSGSGRTRVDVTVAGGTARALESSREQPLGVRFVAFQRPLHTGEALGVLGVGVAVSTSLLLSLQALTGFAMWLTRRKSPEKPRQPT